MRFGSAVITTIVLAGLLACGSTYGTGTVATNGGKGGGPVGSVAVGPGITFASGHNGSANPAVDTIAVGGTVSWTWSGALPHDVQSIGSPTFASSGTLTGSGTYTVMFPAAGTYRYNCVVHGDAMSGTIVVR